MSLNQEHEPLHEGETRYYCSVCKDAFSSWVKAERCCAPRATLRDKFAMAALDCINTKVNEGPPLSPHWRDKTPAELAASAYRVADAMLAERNKG